MASGPLFRLEQSIREEGIEWALTSVYFIVTDDFT